MNYLDILALAVIAFSVLTALFKGLTAELFWLAGVVAGFLLAVHFYEQAANLLLATGMGPMLAGLLGFVLVFLLGVIAGSLAGGWMSRIWKILRLRWLDRLFGAVFGLLRGMLIVVVIFLALTSFSPPDQQPLSGSRLAPYFLTAGQAMLVVAPQDFEVLFRNGYDRLYQIWIERDMGTE